MISTPLKLKTIYGCLIFKGNDRVYRLFVFLPYIFFLLNCSISLMVVNNQSMVIHYGYKTVYIAFMLASILTIIEIYSVLSFLFLRLRAEQKEIVARNINWRFNELSLVGLCALAFFLTTQMIKLSY